MRLLYWNLEQEYQELTDCIAEEMSNPCLNCQQSRKRDVAIW